MDKLGNIKLGHTFKMPKRYVAHIEYATAPHELLMNAMGIIIGSTGILSLDQCFPGEKVVERNDQGLEVRRYGRLILTEVKPLADR